MHERGADGSWNSGVMQSWATDEVALVQKGLAITSDGTPVSLHSVSAHARNRPGAGGLPLLYWVGDFTADLGPPKAHAISVTDAVYADRRIG